MRRLAAVTLLTTLASVLGLPVAAQAAWGSGASGLGVARATGMPAVSTPSATSSGQDVSLSWPAGVITGGTPVPGYVVRRYDSAGVPQVVATNCGGIVSAPSCTEHSVPAGTWRYTVSGVLGLWSGAESSAATVNVATGTVVGSAIAKWEGGATGYLPKGWFYRVYANVLGDPLTVSADVSSVTTGKPAVPLVPGAFSAGGTAYNYRSALLVSSSTLPEGPRSYSVTPTAGVTQTFGVVIDNTPPAGTDVQTTNGGATPGKAEQGDSVTFSFTEPIDADSAQAGWDGSPTAVVVRLENEGSHDTLTVWSADNATAIPLGSLALGADVVSSDTTFGSSAVPSTMTATGSAVTVTLGSPSGHDTRLARDDDPMTWVPSTSLTDRAGNRCTTAVVTESGPFDLPF